MALTTNVRDRLVDQYLDTVENSEAKKAISGERDKFGINVFAYPSDLGSLENLHYVEFGINVRGKSKLSKAKQLFEVTRDPNAAGLSRDQLGSKTLRVVTAGAAAAGAGVATKTILDSAGKGLSSASQAATASTSAIKSKVAKAVNITGAVSQKLSTGAGIVAGAAAGGAILASDILEPDKTYRISDVIALYVDGPPAVKYGMQYSNKDLGTLTAILAGSASATQSALGAASESAAAFGATMAKLPGAFGAADVGAALSASTGTALNPFKEVIFEAVDFRSFNFRYKFMPRSREESDEVKRIIDLFKFHMHPELSEGKLFFIYPSEFQITYYYGSDRNQYFHQFRPCVLENMEVVYGGEMFSTFKDGHPTEVNVALTFRETEILTKNMITEEGIY